MSQARTSLSSPRPSSIASSSVALPQPHTAKRREGVPRSTPILCECGRVLSRTDAYLRHLRAVHQLVQFACPIEGCDKVYNDRSNRDRHVNKFHRQATQTSLGIRVSCHLVYSLLDRFFSGGAWLKRILAPALTHQDVSIVVDPTVAAPCNDNDSTVVPTRTSNPLLCSVELLRTRPPRSSSLRARTLPIASTRDYFASSLLVGRTSPMSILALVDSTPYKRQRIEGEAAPPRLSTPSIDFAPWKWSRQSCAYDALFCLVLGAPWQLVGSGTGDIETIRALVSRARAVPHNGSLSSVRDEFRKLVYGYIPVGRARPASPFTTVHVPDLLAAFSSRMGEEHLALRVIFDLASLSALPEVAPFVGNHAGLPSSLSSLTLAFQLGGTSGEYAFSQQDCDLLGQLSPKTRCGAYSLLGVLWYDGFHFQTHLVLSRQQQTVFLIDPREHLFKFHSSWPTLCEDAQRIGLFAALRPTWCAPRKGGVRRKAGFYQPLVLVYARQG